jgi:hypothetical protein
MRVSYRTMQLCVMNCYALAVSGALVTPLAGQTADSSASRIQTIVTQLPSARSIRISTSGEQWSGRLAARGPDSLSLAGATTTRAVSLAEIDTLWVQGARQHDGLLSGLGFGAMFFGLLQLEDDPGEQPGLTRLGLFVLGGATVAGLLVDGLSPNWKQRYPVSSD